MTFQTSERFLYQGKQLFSNDQPLALHPHAPEFVSVMTMCRRGYNGSWQIEDNQLFLIELDANIQHPTRLKKRRVRMLNPKRLELELEHEFVSESCFIYKDVLEPLVIEVKLLDIFPEAINGPLFADWFSGVINFGQGKGIDQGMTNSYKKYLTLSFVKGVLVGEAIRPSAEVYPPKSIEEIRTIFKNSPRTRKAQHLIEE
jgi:hypothetical protein